jgi:hypothetical protein
MQIFVKDTKTITININPTDNIRTLKEKIHQKTQMPILFQKLIHAGHLLIDDQKSLTDYEIYPESTIWLSVRVPPSFCPDCAKNRQ